MGLGRRTFSPGEVLTASNVMNYLQDQAVMSFAGTAARGSAIGTAVSEGMVSYLADSNSIEVYTGSAWNQVSQATSPNAVINGDFGINQRAFTSTTTNGAYGFDRWKLFYSAGSTTYSAQAFTPGTAPVAGYEAQNYARLVTTGYTSSGWSILQQPIEDVRTFAGQTVTLSFWAKAGSGTPKIMPSVEQNFGSGGSPSSAVRTKGSAVTLSTSWARYSVTISVPSISGKTIGSTANTSSIFAELWVSGEDAGYQNATFDIWGVQLEAGSTATPFRRNANSLQGELAACQRYYEKSYDLNSAPLTNTIAGLHTYFGSSDGSGNIVATVRFAVPKRTASYTVQTYTTTSAGLMGYQRNGASGTSTSFLYRSNENVFHVYCNVGLGWVVADTDFHWTCNAEL